MDGDILGMNHVSLFMPGGGSHATNLCRVDVSHIWNCRYGYLKIY